MATSSAGASVRLIISPRAIPDTTIAPTMSPASTRGRRPGEKPGYQEQAADDLDHADCEHEHLGCGQAIHLERRQLGGVVDELADAEHDEHSARGESQEKESSIRSHPTPLRELRSSYATPVAIA